ncbi:HotDog domain-containing protein [Hyaloraphidium curvatum]|nr:HotDog domain-containing protein [Hyaloraphidium curvatum]
MWRVARLCRRVSPWLVPLRPRFHSSAPAHPPGPPPARPRPRFHSSSSSPPPGPSARHVTASAPPETYVGGYTPITKLLWARRLQWDPSAAPGDGRFTVALPFTTDSVLREEYANPWGAVRVGRTLEDLDSLSGTVAFAHVADGMGEGSAKPTLVTASVDEVRVNRRLALDKDMVMSGRVVWTGASSLDVLMEVRQDGPAAKRDGGDAAASAPQTEPSLVALFSYVALDPVTRKPTRVPPVVPSTDADRALFAERQAIADARRQRRKLPPSSAPPLAPPASALLARLRRASSLMFDLPALTPPRFLPVPSTRLDDAFLTHPQDRNTAGRIFGGFLLRRAFELSFAAAFLFSGARPTFVRCDEVSFAAPVDAGELLRFSARVLAAWPEPEGKEGDWLVAVETVAEKSDPGRRTSEVANVFSYVFRCAPKGRPRVPVPASAEDAAKMAGLLARLPEEDAAAIAGEVEAAEAERCD